jgi:hypothetical protein
MEIRTSTKNVVIKDRTYQISKLDARTACWLFTFMGERSKDGQILSGLGRCTRQEFTEVQGVLLGKVTHLDNQDGNVFPIAIIGPTGGFSVADLSEDAETVMRLTTESLMLSLSPFFIDRESSSQGQVK